LVTLSPGRTDAHLEQWRQFRDDQLLHIDDYRQSSYLIDQTSAFNIRPPELLVFDDLQVCLFVWSITVHQHQLGLKCQDNYKHTTRCIGIISTNTHTNNQSK
jgi:hypothetical protein